ncbi:hypothetical protein [Bacillus thuringiensis]|uniref:hypothetical protein n=1 Tax=Bacillus thuringiensis TaxID=1428 RepID=UPI000D56D4F5|nr:hypothetical protein [Bacillus thuringiensis]MBD8075454.1 hypothetical protein [Bacillus thuringiensis]MCU5036432.1 helix-turn-helix domain-containing protein [Bacillus cereus]
MIFIIGLQKVLNVFNLNAIKLAKEIGVSSRTVYDWLQGKKNIPKKRIDQLSQIPRFKYLDREIFQKEINSIDEIDIEIACAKYRSDTGPVVVEDDNGFPVVQDPFGEEIPMLLKMRKLEEEVREVTLNLYDTNYLEGLDETVGDKYFSAVSSLNNIFNRNNANKINVATDFLVLLDNKELTAELAKDLRKIIQKQHATSGVDVDEHNI